MGRYVRLLAFRLLQTLISLFVLMLICFGLLRFFPGSPLNQEETLDPQVVQRLKDFYRLDDSLGDQFVNYLQKVFQGDLGDSMHFVGRSVHSLILEFGRTSLSLGLMAFLFALGFAWTYAVFTRRHRLQRKMDPVLLVGLSVPTFVLGPSLIWFFGFYLSWLPVALLETPASYILPVLILAFKSSITLARLMSTSLDQTLQERFVQTARSLGFSETVIVSKWALRNSWTPFLAQVGPLFTSLISGSFLVELMFSIPGLSSHFVESVLNRDWPLILGITLVYGTFLMLTQMIMDLLTQLSDPRVKSL